MEEFSRNCCGKRFNFSLSFYKQYNWREICQLGPKNREHLERHAVSNKFQGLFTYCTGISNLSLHLQLLNADSDFLLKTFPAPTNCRQHSCSSFTTMRNNYKSNSTSLEVFHNEQITWSWKIPTNTDDLNGEQQNHSTNLNFILTIDLM